MNNRITLLAAGVVAIIGGSTSLARSQPASDYDFDFVTIGAPGNAPYTGQDRFGLLRGNRGSVPYEYRIARTEVTTGQWMEFVNTFSMREDPWQGLGFSPTFWGATVDADYAGPGVRWTLRTDVPNAGMIPLIGITWRDAAMYCNWLNNDKSADPAGLTTGAYDTSTFVNNPDGTFADQMTRSPGARFFIPSLDEWIKAAHYDPDRYGDGQEGYWRYSHGSDDFPIPGLPGMGQTSAGIDNSDWTIYDIPLGAYGDVQSPWGLLDTSGGGAEWTEELLENRWRIADGYYTGSSDPASYPYPYLDEIDGAYALHPESVFWMSLRIASPVPSPGAVVFAVVVVGTFGTRRTRK